PPAATPTSGGRTDLNCHCRGYAPAAWSPCQGNPARLRGSPTGRFMAQRSSAAAWGCRAAGNLPCHADPDPALTSFHPSRLSFSRQASGNPLPRRLQPAPLVQSSQSSAIFGLLSSGCRFTALSLDLPQSRPKIAPGTLAPPLPLPLPLL